MPNLIRRKLLENPHRVTLTLRPDEKLESRRQEAIREALARRKAELTDEEVRMIVDRAKALEERQMHKDDDSILPKVDLSDVPLQMPEPEAVMTAIFRRLFMLVAPTVWYTNRLLSRFRL